MSKKKIVVKMPMNTPKLKSKALTTASGLHGAIQVGIEGKEKDELVVIGEGLDPVELVERLQEKMSKKSFFPCICSKNKCPINLIEVKDADEKKKDDKKKGEETAWPYHSCYYNHGYPSFVYDVVELPTRGCW